MNVFAILDFTNIFIAVYLGAFILGKDTSSKLNRIFFYNCLMAAYTAYCEYFRLTAANEYVALFWHRISFLWPFFPAVFTKLTMILTDNKYEYKLSFNLLLILPGAFIAYVHLFTDLLYIKLIKQSFGWSHIVSNNFISLIIPIYVTITAIFSIILIIRYYIEQKDRKKRIKVLFAAIGLTIPFVTGFITEDLFPKLGIVIPPVTSVAFLFGTFFLAVSLLNYNVFVADPISTIRQLLATIEDILIIFDQEGKILHSSNSFLKFIGVDVKDFINKRLSDYFYKGNNPVDFEILEITGKEIELTLINENNEIIPISVITSIISEQSASDKMFLLLGRDLRERKRFESTLFEVQNELETKVVERTVELTKKNINLKHEITERELIEKALRESERRFRNLFENSPIGIYRTTPDGRILLANPALVKMLGYNSFDELAYRNLEETGYEVRTYSREMFKKKIEEAGEIIGMEAKWQRKDGTILILRENAKCFYDEKNNVMYYDGTVEDITEKVLAEAALKESEEKFRALSEQLPNMIFLHDTKKFIYVNNRCLEITGFKKEEVLSPDFYLRELMPDYVSQVFGPIPDEVKRGEITHSKEISITRKDGERKSIILSIKNVSNILNMEAYLGVITDITLMKKAEDELKESEERYRGLVENVNAIYYVASYHGKIIYLSPNAVSFTGFENSELIGETAFKIVHRSDANRVIRYYSNCIKRGDIDIFIEFKLAKKDGSYIWAEQISRVIRDENGRAKEYRNVVRDITERKNTESALRESEERYRSLFENTSAVMLLVDPQSGLLKGANKAASKYYGYTTDEFYNMNISDICISYKNDPMLLLKTYDEDQQENLFHKLSNGEIRDVEVHSGLIKMNHRDVIFSIVIDITKRRIAEKQLEEYKNQLEILVEERTQKLNNVNKLLEEEIDKLKLAEENIQYQVSFLRTLIDTIPNPIFIRDAEKKFTDCNKAYANFFGVEKEKIIGTTVFENPFIINSDFIDKKDDELIKNPKQQNYQVIIKDKNGIEHDILAFRAAFMKNDGTFGGVIGTLLDITEIKKLEKEVRNALEKEKELSELKSRFISVASHEFRTPLTSILASADLLEMYGRNWPEKKYFEYVSHIQRAVEYMTELINDVLTVSRADTNKISFNPEKVNLNDMLKNLVENAKLAAPANIRINLEVKISNYVLYLDKKLITQIVSNLINNAVKYSPAGGTVDLIVENDSANLYIIVHDNGIGISEEDQKRLFEPFHRGNNVGAISGTGLGLSIAKKSAEIHNGDILVSSKLNEGTTFTVVLNID